MVDRGFRARTRCGGRARISRAAGGRRWIGVGRRRRNRGEAVRLQLRGRRAVRRSISSARRAVIGAHPQRASRGAHPDDANRARAAARQPGGARARGGPRRAAGAAQGHPNLVKPGAEAPLVLGLDIGGSSSRARLAEGGRTLSEASAPGANVALIDPGVVEERLTSLIEQLGSPHPATCCAGAAGAEVPAGERRLVATESDDLLETISRVQLYHEAGQWAALAGEVFDSLALDAGAARIIDSAADALASLALRAGAKVGVDGPVVMAGGLITNFPDLASRVQARVGSATVLEEEPVAGAVRLAESL